MNRDAGASAPWAILLGIFLLVEGLWGLKSPVVFGVLSDNWLHAIIEIVLGIIGIGTGVRGGSRRFCHFVGWLLLIVGVLYWVPVAREIVISLLNVNVYVAGLNIIIGIITLTIARVSRPERVVAGQGSSA
jgi:hypothetical protein